MVNQLAYVISAPVLLAFSVQFYKLSNLTKNHSAKYFFIAITLSCIAKIGLFLLYKHNDMWSTLLFFTTFNFIEKLFFLFGLFYLLNLKMHFKAVLCVFLIIYAWFLVGWWLEISAWNFRGLLAIFNASFYISTGIFLIKFKHKLKTSLVNPALLLLALYTVFWLSLYPILAIFPGWKTIAIYGDILLCIALYINFYFASVNNTREQG